MICASLENLGLLVSRRYVTVFAAAITGWLIPFRMAYMSVGYEDAHVQGATVLEVSCCTGSVLPVGGAAVHAATIADG
jgi:hypothetical protein